MTEEIIQATEQVLALMRSDDNKGFLNFKYAKVRETICNGDNALYEQVKNLLLSKLLIKARPAIHPADYILEPLGWTFKGFEAEKQKGIKKEKDDNRIKWPQKYWWAILILGWIGGCWTDIGKELVRKKILQESNQLQPAIQVVHDTVYIHDNDKNQDILKK